MILTKEYIKQVVAEYFKDKPVLQVYLFGSYATENANENSDVDLIVKLDDSKKKISFLQMLQFQEGLELKLNKKIDFVEEEMIYPKIKRAIDLTKSLIYYK